jgi:hypothetical protein
MADVMAVMYYELLLAQEDPTPLKNAVEPLTKYVSVSK